MRTRIQLFIRIWIQEDKPMKIQADPDPNQTFKPQKVEFYMKYA
jgi:hypothetical protein